MSRTFKRFPLAFIRAPDIMPQSWISRSSSSPEKTKVLSPTYRHCAGVGPRALLARRRGETFAKRLRRGWRSNRTRPKLNMPARLNCCGSDRIKVVMARLVIIGSRILNLDQIKCVERKGRGRALIVDIFTETGPISGSEDLVKRPMNFRFVGQDAKTVWEKLAEKSETWGLQNEMPSE